jgi:hypothetical protein
MNIRYKKLTESLKLLSLQYNEQVKCFPKFVDVPFEVIDTFYNAFLLLPTLLDEKALQIELTANILRINNSINIITNNPQFKDLDETQFEKSEEWNKIREFSKEILLQMGEPLEWPDLKFI